MTLPLPTVVRDPEVQQNLDRIAAQFPIQASNLGKPAGEVVLSGASESLKVIRGIVSTTTPTIVKGSGFTLTKSAPGRVTINFTVAFSDIPSVTFAPSDGSHISTIMSEQATASKAVTVTLSTLFEASEGIFHFIAIGPR